MEVFSIVFILLKVQATSVQRLKFNSLNTIFLIERCQNTQCIAICSVWVPMLGPVDR